MAADSGAMVPASASAQQVAQQERQSLDDLKGKYEKLSDAFAQSANVWGRYGVAGGSLVFGGGIAIVGLTATIITLKGWTPSDLIACMAVAVLLILIGTATQLINTGMKDRRFKVEVELYAKYQEGV